MILTFWGEEKTHVSHQPGRLMTLPLIILAFFSVVAGFIELPHNFGHLRLFSGMLERVLPHTVLKAGINGEGLFQALAFLATFAGIYLAYFFYEKQPQRLDRLKQNAGLMRLYRFWYAGWYFDRLYQVLFVRPFVYIASINKNDVIDRFYDGITGITAGLYRSLSYTQSGSLRWYIVGLVVGAIVILGIEIML